MSFVSTYSALSIRGFVGQPTGWIFANSLSKTSTTANIELGYSVDIDNNGQYAVLGSRGLTYATVYTGSSFSSLSNITPSYGGSTSFGDNIVINGVGNIISAADSSNVVVFYRAISSWSQTQVLTGFTGGLVTVAVNNTDEYLAIASGNVNVYTGANGTYSLQQTLTTNNSGRSAIAFNATGDYLISGNTGYNSSRGQLFVYNRSGTTWSLQQTLQPSITAVGATFGNAADINEYGNVIVVSAPSMNSGAGVGSGTAYVFNRSGTTWTQTQILLPNDTASNQNFGSSISINNIGNVVMIGADGDDAGGIGTVNRGAVYVFENIQNTWIQTQKIISPAPANSEFFGFATSLAGNASIALIGAPGNDVPNTNVGVGYIFTQ